MSTEQHAVGATPLETVAQSLGASNVLVFRHVRERTLALLGGVGVGAAWAGNVTVELDREPLLARAWEGEVVRVNGATPGRVAGPFFSVAATIMRVGDDAVVLASNDDRVVDLPIEVVFPVARAAAQATAMLGGERRLEDELAVVTVLREAVDAHALGDPHACAAIERALERSLAAGSVTIVPVTAVDSGCPLARLARRVADNEAPSIWVSDVDADDRDAPVTAVAYLAAPVGAPPIATILAIGVEQGFTALHVRIIEAVAAAITSTVVRSLAPPAEPQRIAAAFATAASLRATATPGDAAAVGDLAAAIAAQLALPEADVETIRIGGVLRDVGTLSVPESVLSKPSCLDEGEWSLVRSHTVVGAEIVGRFVELRDAAPAVLHHHERWDGGGYPSGLRGEAIPLSARIVSAADAFHAIVAERPYRPARSASEALAELQAGAGSQFDPTVIAALATVVTV